MPRITEVTAVMITMITKIRITVTITKKKKKKSNSSINHDSNTATQVTNKTGTISNVKH